MANFEPIIQWILYIEDDHKAPGKIVDLGDGAGPTRLGLTQRWHQHDLPMEFFSTMSFKDAVSAAKIVYRRLYWNRILGDLINSDLVAAPLLSFSINDTTQIATKTLQSILDVEQDGEMGPKTLAELATKDPVVVAKLFRTEWIDFYQQLVRMNPAKKQFLDGWINRANFPYPSQIPGVYQ